MTEKEAKSCIGTIEMLRRLAYNIHGVMDVIDADNCEKIIKALEQESCEDAISRQAVLTLAKEECDTAIIPYRRFVKDINALQSVNPQPKTGHWVVKDDKEQGYDIGGVKTWYIKIMCSECGFIKTVIEGRTGQYHYCPSCGCRMVKPQEREG